MIRVLLISLLLAAALIACKKETVTPSVVDVDALQSVPDAVVVPQKEKPVILAEADIAPFIAHFPAINAITERYNKEMDQKENNRSVLKSEGQREIHRYLKEQGLEPREFMRRAAKIIRAWIGLKLLSDPALMNKQRAAVAAKFTDPLERMAAETQARNELKGRAEGYLRSLSAEERALMEKRHEELSSVLKDIPVE